MKELLLLLYFEYMKNALYEYIFDDKQYSNHWVKQSQAEQSHDKTLFLFRN